MPVASKRIEIVLSLVMGVLTLAPYLLAISLVTENIEFSGFLLNPVDGHSYLAKMRQGFEGHWLFSLPYVPDPGQGTFLFTFYLLLGHVSGWLGLGLISTFHLARFLSVVLMYFMAFRLAGTFLQRDRARGFAYIFLMVGSGFGWLGILLGLQAADLLIPESILFYSALVNPHFPLAAAIMFGSISLAYKGEGSIVQLVLAFLLGLTAAIVLPFSYLTTVALLAVWFLWELKNRRRVRPLPESLPRKPAWPLLIALGLGGAGPLLYDLYVVRTHPVLAQWSAQNVTPSPGPLEFGLGYGLLLIFAVLAVVRLRPFQSTSGRLIISWVVVTILLIYAPLSLQRRFSLGLLLPISILAARFTDEIVAKRWGLKWTTAAIIILIVPSNILVILAGMSQLQSSDALIYEPGELQAYQWIDKQSNITNPLVLTGAVGGNRLPAYASARVLYGHPFETPDAEEALANVEQLLNPESSSMEHGQQLRSNGIDFVLLTNRESAQIDSSWVKSLSLVYSADDVRIYETAP